MPNLINTYSGNDLNVDDNQVDQAVSSGAAKFPSSIQIPLIDQNGTVGMFDSAKAPDLINAGYTYAGKPILEQQMLEEQRHIQHAQDVQLQNQAQVDFAKQNDQPWSALGEGALRSIVPFADPIGAVGGALAGTIAGEGSFGDEYSKAMQARVNRQQANPRASTIGEFAGFPIGAAITHATGLPTVAGIAGDVGDAAISQSSTNIARNLIDKVQSPVMRQAATTATKLAAEFATFGAGMAANEATLHEQNIGDPVQVAEYLGAAGLTQAAIGAGLGFGGSLLASGFRGTENLIGDLRKPNTTTPTLDGTLSDIEGSAAGGRSGGAPPLPDDFPQFEGAPSPELAKNMAQIAGLEQQSKMLADASNAVNIVNDAVGHGWIGEHIIKPLAQIGGTVVDIVDNMRGQTVLKQAEVIKNSTEQAVQSGVDQAMSGSMDSASSPSVVGHIAQLTTGSDFSALSRLSPETLKNAIMSDNQRMVIANKFKDNLQKLYDSMGKLVTNITTGDKRVLVNAALEGTDVAPTRLAALNTITKVQDTIAEMRKEPDIYTAKQPIRQIENLVAPPVEGEEVNKLVTKIQQASSSAEIHQLMDEAKQQAIGRYLKYDKQRLPPEQELTYLNLRENVYDEFAKHLEDTDVYGAAGAIQKQINSRVSPFMRTMDVIRRDFMDPLTGEVSLRKVMGYIKDPEGARYTSNAGKQEWLNSFNQGGNDLMELIQRLYPNAGTIKRARAAAEGMKSMDDDIATAQADRDTRSGNWDSALVRLIPNEDKMRGESGPAVPLNAKGVPKGRIGFSRGEVDANDSGVPISASEPYRIPDRYDWENRVESKKGGFDANDLESTLQDFKDKHLGAQELPYTIVQSAEDAKAHLPEEFGDQVKSTDRGIVVFDENNTPHIILVADNIKSAREAAQVLMHETIGHVGMEQYMGSHFEDFLDAVYAKIGDTVEAKIKGRYKFDTSTVEGQRSATKEYLALLAEDPGTFGKNIWQKTWQKVSDYFRKFFGLSLNEEGVKTILRDSYQSFKEGIAGDAGLKDQAIYQSTKDSNFKTGEQQPVPQSASEVPTFYSKMQRVLEQKLPVRGTPDEMKQLIDKFAQKGDFKKEEYEWSSAQDDKLWNDTFGEMKVITKKDVLDFLGANDLKVEEKVLGDSSENNFKEKWINEIIDNPFDSNFIGSGHVWDDTIDEQLRKLVKKDPEPWQHFNPAALTKSQMRVIFDTIGDNEKRVIASKLFDDVQGLGEFSNASNLSKWQRFSFLGRFERGGKDYRELLFKIPDNRFESNIHWPKDKGVFAHARVGGYEDVDGNNLLVAHEVQSDLHQQGRDQGYMNKKESVAWDKLAEKRDKLYDQMEKADEEYNKVCAQIEEKMAESGWVNRDDVIGFLNKNPELNDRLDKVKSISNDVQEKSINIKNRMEKLENKLPDTPFKNTWQEFAMKRLIRMAADEGYDGIAWTRGYDQVGRWADKDRVPLRSIKWTFNDNSLVDDYKLFVTNMKGQEFNSFRFEDNKEGIKEMQKMFGKDVTDKIVADKEKGRTQDVIITKDFPELTMGGEQFKSFYDGQLTNFLNAVGKQSGEKVDVTKLPEEVKRDWRDAPKRQIDVNRFLLPQDLKDSVRMQGQPMFMRGAIDYSPLADQANLVSLQKPFIANELGRQLSPMGQYAPDITKQVTRQISSTLDYLAQKVPRDPNAEQYLGSSGQYIPSPIEVDEFNNAKQIALRPLSILEDLRDGSITQDKVDALQKLYPDLYQDIRNRLLEKIGQKKNIDYDKLTMASAMFQLNAVPELNQNYLDFYQSLHQQQKAQENQKKVNRMASIQESHDAKTPTQRLL